MFQFIAQISLSSGDMSSMYSLIEWLESGTYSISPPISCPTIVFILISLASLGFH